MARWCVLAVPGWGRLSKGVVRDTVVHNLLGAEAVTLKVSDRSPSPNGPTTLSAVWSGDPAPFAEMDVAEIYWSDLIPHDGDMRPLTRLLRGFQLVQYWVLSLRAWAAVRSASWFVALGCIISALILLIWLAAAAASVGHWVLQLLHWKSPQLYLPTPNPGWAAVYHALTVGVPLAGPVLVVADIAQFSRSYLESETTNDGISVRAAIRLRVRDALVKALAAKPSYDRIILVGHSFGTLPLIDLLADWPRPEDLQRMKIVTLGSPAGLFAFRSDWMRDQIRLALGRGVGHGWADFRLASDFWCTGVRSGPNAKKILNDALSPGFTGSFIPTTGAVWAGVSGSLHNQYYSREEVVSAVLS